MPGPGSEAVCGPPVSLLPTARRSNYVEVGYKAGQRGYVKKVVVRPQGQPIWGVGKTTTFVRGIFFVLNPSKLLNVCTESQFDSLSLTTPR